MRLILKVNICDSVESFDDLLIVLAESARTLTDPSAPLEDGMAARVLKLHDNEVGEWKVVAAPEA
jgi:hypothetical protein